MCYVLYELNQILPAILACVTVMTCAIDLSAGEGWIRIGPFGGGAEIVRVSPSVPDTVLAATRAGIIFKSIDRGAHWEVAGQAPGPGCVIHALAVHPLQDDTWLAGFDCEAAGLSGLYETRDGGKTWSAVPALRGQTAWSVAFSNDGDRIAAGMSDGVYLNERGQGWSRISPVSNTDLKPVVSLNFDPHDEEGLYAGTTHLPWRTKDRGKTWESIHSGMLDDSDVFSIEPDPRKPTRVYASACSGAYISENQGANWSRLPTPRGAYRAYFVALDPFTRETLFVATSAGLFRSSDNGHTWKKLSADIIKSAAFDRSRKGVIYFASQSTGVLSTSDDGDTLHHNADGFSNQNFCGLAALNGSVYAAVREGAGCQLLEHSERGWRPVVTPAPIKALSATGKALYVSSGWRVLSSRDGGRTWTELAKAAADSMSALGGSELEISPDGTIAKLTGDTAMFSLDGGAKWSPCRPAKPDLVWYGLAMHGGHDVFGFAATSRGLFRVSGNCATWDAVDGGLSLGTVSLIYPHPTNADVFAAAQEGRVFLTLDAGAEWRRLSDQGRHGMFPAALAIDPTIPNRIYALFPGLGVAYQDFFAEAARTTQNRELSQH